MLHTSLCDLLGISAPIIQAPMVQAATWRLASAVSNAGGLGSLSSVLASAERLKTEIGQVREHTNGPFAVNHILNQFDAAAWELTLAARPPVISFALGDPESRIDEAHAAGSLVMQQVVTVGSAARAAERGVDVIIAQGSEAGGNSGLISLFALLPQVVDAVRPIPVVAAGGLADGRGLAAALMLGAQGVNLGTRFLASEEATIHADWKAAILAAGSSDVAKFVEWNAALPPAPGDYFTIPNVIRSQFVRDTQARAEREQFDPAELRGTIFSAVQNERLHELVPMAGQSAGLIHDLPAAGDIVTRIVDEAVAALGHAPEYIHS